MIEMIQNKTIKKAGNQFFNNVCISKWQNKEILCLDRASSRWFFPVVRVPASLRAKEALTRCENVIVVKKKMDNKSEFICLIKYSEL
jgi:hypothetical protein